MSLGRKNGRINPAGGAWLLAALTVLVYALHQDFWNWTATAPLLFGFLPVGLWYHAAYCLVASALMWLLAKWAWPKWTEDDVER